MTPRDVACFIIGYQKGKLVSGGNLDALTDELVNYMDILKIPTKDVVKLSDELVSSVAEINKVVSRLNNNI